MTELELIAAGATFRRKLRDTVLCLGYSTGYSRTHRAGMTTAGRKCGANVITHGELPQPQKQELGETRCCGEGLERATLEKSWLALLHTAFHLLRALV
jgi:hypothetical protein